MPLTPQQFLEFEQLVQENGRHNEIECGAHLAAVADALLEKPAITWSAITEHRNFYGSVDLIVVAAVRSNLNRVENHAYIWELKSPQTVIMERDDNAFRFRPADGLVKAENQLLHYTYLLQEDGATQRSWNISDPSHIKMGGIVIGRMDRMLVRTAPAGDLERAERSLSIRARYFYEKKWVSNNHVGYYY